MAYSKASNQSKGMTKAMKDELKRTLSGFSGMATSAVAEPIAGLNALLHGNPELVDRTRNALTYGNPAYIIPRNFRLPESVNTGIGYFNQSADALGDRSPFLGAALKTAPAFVGALAAPQSRAAFANVTDDIGRAVAQNAGRQIPRGIAQGGYTAYHGTPHNVDKFSSSKIGTGEGAQAYGHGLYFADSKSVADSYRKGLTGVSGKPIKIDNSSLIPRTNERTIGEAIDSIDREILIRKSNIQSAKENPDVFSDGHVKKLKSELADYKKRRDEINRKGGNLYRVDIPDEHLKSMIDYDAPLNKQPLAIKRAFKQFAESDDGYKLAREYHSYRDGNALTDLPEFKNPQGETIVNLLQHKAADYGVKGVRYLDRSSRSRGKGTRNTVLFDDSIVSITGQE